MNNCGENNQEAQPTTLYVGCLDIQVTEEYLLCLFSQIGSIKNLKIIQEKIEPYAFIEFFDHQVALTALAFMNGRKCYGKEMKVNWSSAAYALLYGTAKVDTSSHFHVFVGDIGQEVTSEVLREAFAQHGTISDCKIVRDVQTLKPKGYGFITFVNKNEAETAISVMNGHWLGNRSIRTNWAIRRPHEAQKKQDREENRKQYSFDEVYKQTGPTNSNVYVGNTGGLDKEMVAKVFAPFGNVREIRFFADKEYAFVLFTNKESATKAIVAMNNTDVNGHTLKCWWGNNGNGMEVMDGFPGVNSIPPVHQQYDQTSDSSRYQYPYGYGYGQETNFWQQPGYSAAPPNMYQQVQQTNSQGKQTETAPGYFYGANYHYQQNFMPLQQENFLQNQQQHPQQQLQWTPQCLHYAPGLNNWYDPGSQNKTGYSASTVTDSSSNSDVIVSGPYSSQTK